MHQADESRRLIGNRAFKAALFGGQIKRFGEFRRPFAGEFAEGFNDVFFGLPFGVGLIDRQFPISVLQAFAVIGADDGFTGNMKQMNAGAVWDINVEDMPFKSAAFKVLEQGIESEPAIIEMGFQVSFDFVAVAFEADCAVRMIDVIDSEEIVAFIIGESQINVFHRHAFQSSGSSPVIGSILLE